MGKYVFVYLHDDDLARIIENYSPVVIEEGEGDKVMGLIEQAQVQLPATSPDRVMCAFTWIADFLQRDTPYRKTKCVACEAGIERGTRAYRYITGFYQGQANLAFLCDDCGLDLTTRLFAHFASLPEFAGNRMGVTQADMMLDNVDRALLRAAIG